MKQWNLCYKTPAKKWVEALPLGNGHIGAMVYGGCMEDRISLNLDTLWSGQGKDKGNENSEQRNWKKIRNLLSEDRFSEAEEQIKDYVLGDWTEAYMPAGNLWLNVQMNGLETPEDYVRNLNLNTGIYENTYKAAGTELKKEMFVSMDEKLMAVKLCALGENIFDLDVKLDSLLSYEMEENAKTDRLVLCGHAPVYAAPNYYQTEEPIRYEENKGIAFTWMLQAVSDTKIISRDAEGLHIKGAKEVVLYLSGMTNFKPGISPELSEESDWKQKAVQALENACAAGYDVLKEKHMEVHRSYFERVELEIGEQNETADTLRLIKDYEKEQKDQTFAALMFQYGRYLLIASSAPGSQCANLQGIWNESLRAPWSSNYTVNINTEMNYWMAESCNLSEFHTPLFELIERMSENGRKTARDLYGLEGWVSHHNVDLWGHTTPVGRYADTPDSCVYSMWNMSSGWMCRHLWEHYCYTLDEKFLKEKAFPIMEESVRFYLGYLTEKDGYLVTMPSTSPENMFLDENGEMHSTSIASTMDISILKELFTYYIEACEVLQVEGLKKQVQEALKMLPPFKIGKYGQLQEWYQDWKESDEHHRHVSHLYGLYPSNIITRQEEELRSACETALNRRGDEGTGWCIVWKACLWARLGDGNRALQVLANQMRFTDQENLAVVGGGTYSNLFCAHPPFQIDGNFGYTAAVTEMLLQSQEKKIELLPALPDVWKDGKVKGLKARGNYEVAFEWKNHKIVQIKIFAKEPGEVMLRYNDTEEKIVFTENEKEWFWTL